MIFNMVVCLIQRMLAVIICIMTMLPWILSIAGGGVN